MILSSQNEILDHAPLKAAKRLVSLLGMYPGQVKISAPRRTKLGDFRPYSKNKFPVITVNRNLDKYSFLITLVHELAHYFTWKEYGKSVKPHGKEWKNKYSELLSDFLNEGIFPESLNSIIHRHVSNPKSSSCMDHELYKALNKDGISSHLTFISELSIGSEFRFRNRGCFVIMERLRKRFKCRHLETNKIYLFQPISEVEPV